MEHMTKKTAALFIITGSMFVCTAAYAAIPVVDDNNILQQLKTYEQTVKVVENTATQITHQLKELEKLPTTILNGYKSVLSQNRTKLTNILYDNGTLIRSGPSSKVDITTYIQNHIPGISGSTLPQTMTSAKSAKTVTLSTLRSNNENTLKAIQDLVAELDTLNDELENAENDSANAEGAMQAQQAANHIAAIQSRIQNIKVTIQALEIQQQALKLQADAQEKTNQLAVEEAQAAAEKAVIDDMQSSVNSTIPVSSPFRTYGNHTFL